MEYKVQQDGNKFTLDTHYGLCDATVYKAMEMFDNYNLKLLNLQHNDKIFYIENLYIQDNYLNQGLAKELLSEMLKMASKRGFNGRIYLTAEPVDHKNFDLFQLVEFYKRRGFEVITGNSIASLMKYGKST